jgi:hypothetical protein
MAAEFVWLKNAKIFNSGFANNEHCGYLSQVTFKGSSDVGE